MPRMSKKKFTDEEGSVRERLEFDMDQATKDKFYWNQKQFYDEYYEKERWAERGFTEDLGG